MLEQPDPCIAVRIDDDPSIQWLIYDQYTFQAKAAERNQAWHWVGDLVSLGGEQKHHAEECYIATRIANYSVYLNL